MGTTTEKMADIAAEAPSVNYGRPKFDFAAAPSLFAAEDIRQEELALGHRGMIHANLEEAEKLEATAVQTRRTFERNAAAALAEEAGQICRNAVAQRAALEAKFADAKQAAE